MIEDGKITEELKFNSLIGKNLISLDLGIGEIKSVLQLYENEDDFFQVSFNESNSINYFSTTSHHGFRLISSKKRINDAISIFKSKPESKNFTSVQDKLNFYKIILKSDDICELAKNISILHGEKDLHTQIKKYYEKALKSFVLEINFVLELKRGAAWELLEIKNPFK